MERKNTECLEFGPEVRREGEDMGLFQYEETKKRYLEICRRYGLNPFDLDILSQCVSRLPKRDKISLVKAVIFLVRIERECKARIKHGLFPLTVQEMERSGYLVPSKH